MLVKLHCNFSEITSSMCNFLCAVSESLHYKFYVHCAPECQLLGHLDSAQSYIKQQLGDNI